jgi:hypothetical protein
MLGAAAAFADETGLDSLTTRKLGDAPSRCISGRFRPVRFCPAVAQVAHAFSVLDSYIYWFALQERRVCCSTRPYPERQDRDEYEGSVLSCERDLSAGGRPDLWGTDRRH